MIDLLQYEIEFWSKGCSFVAGVDEAGRGPLAGPVVAAAVVFPKNDFEIRGIKDSKLLSFKVREEIAANIRKSALSVGIGKSDHEEIDQVNILQASLNAMQRAVQNLNITPHQILVDGRDVFETRIPCRACVKGDLHSRVIAAASIIAKVERDRIMLEYDRTFPIYGFSKHKGYPTRYHINAIREHGLSSIHRKSFKVKELEQIQS